MGAVKSGGQEVRVDEVFVETAPGGKVKLAGSKECGWGYTEQDLGAQNGNSG
jgi:hypothetical protein